jgi:hypothetical protein
LFGDLGIVPPGPLAVNVHRNHSLVWQTLGRIGRPEFSQPLSYLEFLCTFYPIS